LGIIAIIGDEKKQVRTSSNWRYLCPAIRHLEVLAVIFVSLAKGEFEPKISPSEA
jgi:hypothetical protein